MSFEVREGRYVSRIFYSELRAIAVPGNMMGWIYRDGPDDLWRLQYRMRYYVDEDLTAASKDRMSWYEAVSKPDATVEKLISGTRVIFEKAGAGQYEEIIVDSSSAEVVMRRLGEQKWCHAETLAPEEWHARKQKSG